MLSKGSIYIGLLARYERALYIRAYELQVDILLVKGSTIVVASNTSRVQVLLLRLGIFKLILLARLLAEYLTELFVLLTELRLILLTKRLLSRLELILRLAEIYRTILAQKQTTSSATIQNTQKTRRVATYLRQRISTYILSIAFRRSTILRSAVSRSSLTAASAATSIATARQHIIKVLINIDISQ